jgi:hypothetical protein
MVSMLPYQGLSGPPLAHGQQEGWEEVKVSCWGPAYTKGGELLLGPWP